MIIPIHISFFTWASQIRIDYPNITIPNPPEEKDWRDWAAQVVQDNGLTGVPLPTKLGYPLPHDWRKWAAYFVSTLYT